MGAAAHRGARRWRNRAVGSAMQHREEAMHRGRVAAWGERGGGERRWDPRATNDLHQSQTLKDMKVKILFMEDG